MAEIKLRWLKAGEGEEWEMTSDQFHTQALDGQAKPGPRCATLIKACYCRHKSQKRGTLNYANLQDKYILISLEYKLMPQLTEQTL